MFAKGNFSLTLKYLLCRFLPVTFQTCVVAFIYASHVFGSYLSLFGLLDQNSGDLSYATNCNSYRVSGNRSMLYFRLKRGFNFHNKSCFVFCLHQI